MGVWRISSEGGHGTYIPVESQTKWDGPVTKRYWAAQLGSDIVGSLRPGGPGRRSVWPR